MCSNKVHKVDKGYDYYSSGDALFMAKNDSENKALGNNGGIPNRYPLLYPISTTNIELQQARIIILSYPSWLPNGS